MLNRSINVIILSICFVSDTRQLMSSEGIYCKTVLRIATQVAFVNNEAS